MQEVSQTGKDLIFDRYNTIVQPIETTQLDVIDMSLTANEVQSIYMTVVTVIIT